MARTRSTSDSWERLVKTTLERELLRQIGHQQSESSSSDSENSPLLNLSNLGIEFSYPQILKATQYFRDENLIKKGKSGDIFRGFLQDSSSLPVVIKRIDLRLSNWEAYSLELNFFNKKNSHSRFVQLLGYCLRNENKMFLVYKYLPNRHLFANDSLPNYSLDWKTRIKIAIGAAEGLAYLHHECNPPLVHGDVQASSIFLDDNFEVRFGSLSQVCAQERDTVIILDNRITSYLLRLYMLISPSEVVLACKASEKDTLSTSKKTCAYDVYCFGKVLLELVTGKVGADGGSIVGTVNNLLQESLDCIRLYDKECVKIIVDPTLVVDEELLEEVWAVALIAKSCLNPNPEKRPLMRHVHKALESPQTSWINSSLVFRLDEAAQGDYSYSFGN